MGSKIKGFIKKCLPKKAIRFIKSFKWTLQANYSQDGLITLSYPDTFTKDPRFMQYYESAHKQQDPRNDEGILWRAHVALWCATRGKTLDGDFVECGVNKAFLSKIIVDYLDFGTLQKKFYLMDTYEGLVEKYITEKEMKSAALRQHLQEYEPCYEEVSKIFKNYKNIVLVKGPIPDTLPQVSSKKIAYLSIDMNCVIPEISAAEYFWDKLVSGAAIVLDDYGHPGQEEQRRGFDKFATEKGVSILCLPTGQGLIFKP